MMLNKEVCQKCVERALKDYKWGKEDENLWRQGFVGCPHLKDDEDYYSSEEFELAPVKVKEVPEYCLYRLEHTVSQ